MRRKKECAFHTQIYGGAEFWPIAGRGGMAASFRPHRKFTYKMSLRSRADDETKEGKTILHANLRVGRILNRNGKAPIFRPTRKFTYKMSLRRRAVDETKEGMMILYANLPVVLYRGCRFHFVNLLVAVSLGSGIVSLRPLGNSLTITFGTLYVQLGTAERIEA